MGGVGVPGKKLRWEDKGVLAAASHDHKPLALLLSTMCIWGVYGREKIERDGSGGATRAGKTIRLDMIATTRRDGRSMPGQRKVKG